MDFELSDDQVALTEGIGALCAGRFDIETVRGLETSDGVDRARWSELGQTGVFSIALAEADGGVGLGFADAALVFEQLGRAAIPGPLVATFLAAGVIDGAADGNTVVGVVERSAPAMVEHLAALDVLLVIEEDGSIGRVDPSTLDGTLLSRPLDPLTPIHRVTGLGAAEPVAGLDPETFRRQGAVLTAALQLGLSEASLDLAVAYAKERQQFGKPIGKFQAVKHMCAEMLARVEVSRAAVYAAAVTIDTPEVGDVDRAVSSAKLCAGEGASFCGKQCVQVHGGMGYTWEVDAHLYLKRGWVLNTSFGTPDDHAERIAATL